MKYRLRKRYEKECFKPEITPMIENLQEKLHQVDCKQVKGAKICVNLRWESEGEKFYKTFLKITDREHMQN